MRRIVLVGAAVVVLTTLTACSGSGGSSSTAAVGGAASEAAGPVAAGSEPQASRAPGTAGKNAAETGGGGTAQTTGALIDDRSLIRTAVLSVAVSGARNVAARADRADALAIRLGGEVDADERTSGAHASATLTLRVLPAQLTATLTGLAALGRELSREASSTDVTQRVADVSSRVTSAQAAIARLRLLFRDTTKVSDVIAVESELSSREADLESLQAQQRALGQETAMATVTLHLTTLAVTPHHAKSSSHGGFLGGLISGWHGFTAAAGAVATAVGAVLPFLLLVLLVGLGGRLLLRRVPRLARLTRLRRS